MSAIAAMFGLIPRWVWAALVAALAATSCKLTIDLGEVKLEVEKARVAKAQLETQIAKANADAASMAASWNDKVVRAQNESIKRETALQRAAIASAAQSSGLLADVATMRLQLGEATREAAIDRANAVATVLGQCANEYQSLAQRSDRHVNDLKTLIDAWPQAPTP